MSNDYNDSITDLIFHLKNTLSLDKSARNNSEDYLALVSNKPGFANLLLDFSAINFNEECISVAAATTFKNITKGYWKNLHSDEKYDIKSRIVDIMLQCPNPISRQLRESICIIYLHDFPDDWPNFMDIIASRIEDVKDSQLVSILSTLQDISER